MAKNIYNETCQHQTVVLSCYINLLATPVPTCYNCLPNLSCKTFSHKGSGKILNYPGFHCEVWRIKENQRMTKMPSSRKRRSQLLNTSILCICLRIKSLSLFLVSEENCYYKTDIYYRLL